MMLEKTDDPDYKKDTGTNAVINTNVAAYVAYKQRRDSAAKVENMERELNDLKQLVKELLNKQNV